MSVGHTWYAHELLHLAHILLGLDGQVIKLAHLLRVGAPAGHRQVLHLHLLQVLVGR